LISDMLPSPLRMRMVKKLMPTTSPPSVLPSTETKMPRTSGAFLPEARCAYLADINATVVSSMRLEKPHSLSYHDETLTRRPETLVSVASKLLEAGLWLKSTETKGSVL